MNSAKVNKKVASPSVKDAEVPVSFPLEQFEIDELFAGLLRPHNADERAALMAEIEAAGGCRDDGVIGIIDGKRMLLDGHQRRNIVAELKANGKHIRDVTYVEKEFANKLEALRWVFRNQQARRSLSPVEAALAVLTNEEARASLLV